jgi:hypothetical protein
MSNFQVYEVIDEMLKNWDDLNKEQIKQQLSEILPPICTNCNERHGYIRKYGRELDPTARYDAASTLYTLCAGCKYVRSYTY